MWNTGSAEVTIDKICFIITFEDDTEIEKQINVGDTLLVGEDVEKEVEIKLPTPIERVVFVEVKSFSFY